MKRYWVCGMIGVCYGICWWVGIGFGYYGGWRWCEFIRWIMLVCCNCLGIVIWCVYFNFRWSYVSIGYWIRVNDLGCVGMFVIKLY